MNLGIEGRVAAVAASSEGLGRAVAKVLAEEGACVAICSRDPEKIQKAAESIEAAARAAGRSIPPVFSMNLDLAHAGNPETFIREVINRFGRLDILVANNGGPAPGRASELDDDEWSRGVDLTYLSSVRLARTAIPEMRKKRWGRIIFITSVSVKQPMVNLAISTALRCGVVGFAKCLADELAADGITVNSVAPGSIATARMENLLAHRAKEQGRSLEDVRAASTSYIPMKRIGRPEELSAAVAFLASELAGYITGVVLPIDGGLARSIA